MTFNVVLYEPEIPGNTGNVARLCAAADCVLHLIEPLGFSLEDSRLRRAGLDYWHLLTVYLYPSLTALQQRHGGGRFWYITTRSARLYTSVDLRPGDFFVFGRETSGLPEGILTANPDRTLRIPMIDNPAARSLNLSNAVAVVVYEAIRQNQTTIGGRMI
ncbi:MAG: tRNA (cytidine(34)-2'-O)-methyltransferase [Negativicutes bacterium]|nr:tRNA (cytidine(34)-2'-O)-methyltransferase [Negativicutes bacterium]